MWSSKGGGHGEHGKRWDSSSTAARGASHSQFQHLGWRVVGRSHIRSRRACSEDRCFRQSVFAAVSMSRLSCAKARGPEIPFSSPTSHCCHLTLYGSRWASDRAQQILLAYKLFKQMAYHLERDFSSQLWKENILSISGTFSADRMHWA